MAAIGIVDGISPYVKLRANFQEVAGGKFPVDCRG